MTSPVLCMRSPVDHANNNIRYYILNAFVLYIIITQVILYKLTCNISQSLDNSGRFLLTFPFYVEVSCVEQRRRAKAQPKFFMLYPIEYYYSVSHIPPIKHLFNPLPEESSVTTFETSGHYTV